MKAYKIHWSDRQRAPTVDLGYRYHLPRVRCRACFTENQQDLSSRHPQVQWDAWGNGDFEYPAFQFDFLNDREFNSKRVVEVRDFRQICDNIIAAAGRPVTLVPGASIGQMTGTSATARLQDFEWGRITVPQISKRARDLLAEDGVNLITAEMSLRCRGKRLDTHLAVQVEPVALLTEGSMKTLGITFCPECGNYIPTTPRPNVAGGYLVNRSLWPAGQHLVKLAETLDVLASREFIEAVGKYSLAGVAFAECGEYV